MRLKSLVLAAAVAAGAALTSQGAAAAAFPAAAPQQSTIADGSLLQEVKHRHRHRHHWHRHHHRHFGRCAKWRHICTDRWGWGWQKRRCLRNHGC